MRNGQQLTARPTGNLMLVRPDEKAELSPGGIALPVGAQQPPKRGLVLRVGPGKMLDSGKRAEMQVRQGDKIMFHPTSAAEVEIEDGVKLLLMSEDNVWLIL
jgi:chaperonin GroES